MPTVVLENCAFILPDDMDAFRRRYGVDVLYLDGEEGYIAGLGPNDKDWRILPDSGDATSGPTIVRIRKDE